MNASLTDLRPSTARALRSGWMGLFALAMALPAAASPSEQVWRMELPVDVRPGEAANLRITPPEGIVPQAKYTAVLMLPEQRGRALQMGFFNPEEGELATETELTGGAPLPLRVLAGHCSPEGDFEGEIRLIPQYDRLAGQQVLPVHIVVRVHVQPDRAILSACHTPFVIAAGRGVLTGFVTMFLFAMITHTHRLKSRHLVQRLAALLQLDSSISPAKAAGLRQEVQYMVNRDFTPGRRLRAWLKANPLKIGLLGGSYHETVELHLVAGPSTSKAFLSLPEKSVPIETLRKDPGSRDRLLVNSQEGLSLFAVLKRDKLWGLRVISQQAEGPSDKHRVIRLGPNDRLEKIPEQQLESRSIYG